MARDFIIRTLAGTVMLTSLAAHSQQYTITELNTLGGVETYGFALNAGGQATGQSLLEGESSRAFISSGAALQDLGTLGGDYSEGFGINVSGEVTGRSDIGTDGLTFAFLYSNGVMRSLGTLGGPTSSGASINDVGQVAGTADTGQMGDFNAPAYHAFLYSDGSMHDLGTLEGTNSVGSGINAGGQITGWSDIKSDTARHAFLFSDGIMHDLGTLGGSSSSGNTINDSGQIAGLADLSGDVVSHAFLYSNGTMHDLGTLGGTFSNGAGINSGGQVVGSADTPSGSAESVVAFLYSGGHMINLNDRIGAAASRYWLHNALAINDRGQILVEASDNVAGATVALILTPPSVFTATTTQLTATPAAAAVGQPIMLTAVVTPASRTGALTGSVVFNSSGTSLGTATINATGRASLTTTLLSAGRDQVTAVYSGNATNDSSTSNAVTVQISKTAAAVLKLSATSLMFGKETVKATAATKSVTLTNVGTATLTLDAITLTGGQADDFAFSRTCGTTLAANASCTISLTFTPVSAGTKYASIGIYGNASSSPQTIALTGMGVAAPVAVVKLSATTLSFGNQSVKTTSAARTVIVTNTGTAPLSISSIFFVGSEADDFALSKTCGTMLAANANCTISVTFTPVSATSKAASISISDSASNFPQSIALRGKGV